MKKTLLLLLFFSCLTATSQKTAKDLFDEGLAYVEQDSIKKSIASFKHIVDHHPKDSLYPMALYNVAYLYAMDEDYNNAIPAFERILNSNLNEYDFIGGNIMDNPYANYKYKASRGLYEIYTFKEDYKKALEYLIMSDEKYPYIHFCGNSACSNETGMALNYASLYTKLGQKDMALIKLLELALPGNKNILAELKLLLAEQEKAKQKFDEAMKNIYSKKGNEETEYYMRFLNAEIYVGYGTEKYPFDEKDTIKKIKETDFYKMLEKL